MFSPCSLPQLKHFPISDCAPVSPWYKINAIQLLTTKFHSYLIACINVIINQIRWNNDKIQDQMEVTDHERLEA